MAGRHLNWFLFPIRSPGWTLGAALLLALTGGLLWYGFRELQFYRDRTAAEQALTQYDFPEARQRLMRCIRFRPRDPGVRLLAVQAARRDGDLDAAQEHLDIHHD